MHRPPSVDHLRRSRILVADDDAVIRLLIRSKLYERADEVVEARDGTEAWDLLRSTNFTLALIDLSMPGLDGLTLIKSIRANPRTEHLPVLVITHSSDRRCLDDAFTAGANSFLTKPVNWALFNYHIDYLSRLSVDGERSRRAVLKAEAAGRAKDAVAAVLTSRLQQYANRILDLTGEQIGTLSRVDQPANEVMILARQIAEEATSIQDTLEDVVPRIRMITEQVVLECRPHPLPSVIRAATTMLAPCAEWCRITIEQSALPSGLVVCCDRDALAHGLAHLLRNAIEASPPGSTVRIDAEQLPDGGLTIAIVDEGCGAQPDYIAHCLAPLDRDNGWSAPDGYKPGLGLPMARAIAHAHGGSLEIRTAPGHGAQALLILPPEIVDTQDA